jgi:hypothetical protein
MLRTGAVVAKALSLITPDIYRNGSRVVYFASPIALALSFFSRRLGAPSALFDAVASYLKS